LLLVLGGLAWLVVSAWAFVAGAYQGEAGECELTFRRLVGILLVLTGWGSATAGLVGALTDPDRAARWGLRATVVSLLCVAVWLSLWPGSFECG
jgi:hypothetical protein